MSQQLFIPRHSVLGLGLAVGQHWPPRHTSPATTKDTPDA